MQGKTVDEVVKDLDNKMDKDEQKQIYKKFFNDDGDDDQKPKGPTEAELLAKKEADEKAEEEEKQAKQMQANQFLKEQLFQSELESEQEEKEKLAKIKEAERQPIMSLVQKQQLPKSKKTLKKERLNKQLRSIETIMENQLGKRELVQIGEENMHALTRKSRNEHKKAHRRAKRLIKYKKKLAAIDLRKRKPYGIFYQENRKYSNALLNLARENMGQNKRNKEIEDDDDFEMDNGNQKHKTSTNIHP